MAVWKMTPLVKPSDWYVPSAALMPIWLSGDPGFTAAAPSARHALAWHVPPPGRGWAAAGRADAQLTLRAVEREVVAVGGHRGRGLVREEMDVRTLGVGEVRAGVVVLPLVRLQRRPRDGGTGKTRLIRAERVTDAARHGRRRDHRRNSG